jgi:PST family polysaccharide transporter
LTLFKTSFFSAIVTFIRLLSGFLVGKVIAVITGPSGIALVGQFSNFISIILNFANGAVNNGVVKYTAQYGEDKEELETIFSTAFKISLYCSAVTGLVLLVLAKPFAYLIFKDYALAYLVRVFGFTVIFYSLNSLLIAILNGRREIKKYAIVNTTGSITGLFITIVLVYFYKINGALLALILTQALAFFVTVAFIYKSDWFRFSYFSKAFNKATAKKLSHFSLMAIVSILTVPVSQILIRNMVINSLGIDSAGYWQGMMKVSDGYLLIITTSLSTYYLPKLSSLHSENDLRKEIANGFKLIMPLVILSCTVIYFLRFIIIKALYTPDFIVMESLFKWQLAGDVLKIATFLFGYIMVAKSMTKYYIMTEIIFNSLYVLFSYILIKYFQLEGTTMAFCLNYLICLLYMIVIFKKLIFRYA